MSQTYFVQVQLPVGQGGFHTGCLFDSEFFIWPTSALEASFAWAYDCGSDQTAALTAQIGIFSGIHFSVLFLSHLDSDHVVGVDKLLLAASSVDEVVLPYLGDDEWVLHLAASVAAGTITSSFIDLAADPATWFGARGVNRIVYVEASGEEDEEGDGPDGLDPSQPEAGSQRDAESSSGPMKVRWSRPVNVILAGDKGTKRAETVLASRGAVAAVSTAGGQLNWVLSPFAFRPSDAKMLAFRKGLELSFGRGLTVKDYADAARTPLGRARLRECYDAVWKSHNLHSMALYSGPSIPAPGKLANTAWHGKFVRRIIQPGWLSLGDFDTSVKRRRDALLRYYSPYAATVGQLALPHHGSDLSFDAAILTQFPDLSCAIAAVGANSHGHPGPGVQAAIAATASVDFVRVDEGPSSIYTVLGPVD